jgi:TM2 domain-containing membrane protein YozV
MTDQTMQQPAVPPGALSGDARALMMFEANKKSIAIAYVLWAFLGLCGAHRFYCGKTGSAIAQLVMTILGVVLLAALGLGLLLLVPVWIWILVDAFLIPGWIRTHNSALATQLGA